VDQYTILNEPILSIDLMERAAERLWEKIVSIFPTKKFCLIAGPGNNGGDAIALFRLCKLSGYDVQLIVVNDSDKFSPDCNTNIKRLEGYGFNYRCCSSLPDFPSIDNDYIIVDGIFGSGLNKPVEGFFAGIIELLNSLPNYKISIDIPSGLFDAENIQNQGLIFRASETFTLQFPKLSFFFAENDKFVGNWHVVDIGLHPEAINKTETNYFQTRDEDVQLLYIPRKKHAHKGVFGHALIVAGSEGKYGALVLCTQACLRSGAGLVTASTDEKGEATLNCTIPEAMVVNRRDFLQMQSFEKFSSVAIGPGLGVNSEAVFLLESILKGFRKPMVLDADALNILSERPEIVEKIPANSIITPHVGEFDRITGKSTDSYERIQKATQLSKKHSIITVLKGANTAVIDTEGNVYFNSTGNPGMATAGSGDVLTGIIAGLLSTGYSPLSAAILGVWLHGKAGDNALREQSFESLLASDIINCIGLAYKRINSQ
jgi:NAD(P)H-hydrate epimerase